MRFLRDIGRLLRGFVLGVVGIIGTLISLAVLGVLAILGVSFGAAVIGIIVLIFVAYVVLEGFKELMNRPS